VKHVQRCGHEEGHKLVDCKPVQPSSSRQEASADNIPVKVQPFTPSENYSCSHRERTCGQGHGQGHCQISAIDSLAQMNNIRIIRINVPSTVCHSQLFSVILSSKLVALKTQCLLPAVGCIAMHVSTQTCRLKAWNATQENKTPIAEAGTPAYLAELG
jgi:hypothetical protein